MSEQMNEEPKEEQESMAPGFDEVKKPQKKLKGRKRMRAACRRSEMFHVRVTPGEWEAIVEMVHETRFETVSDFVVNAIFSYTNTPIPERRNPLLTKKKERREEDYI